MQKIKDQAERLEEKINKLTDKEKEEVEREIKSLLARLALEASYQL